MARVGAEIVERRKICEQIAGSRPSTMMILVEYPSHEAVHELFSSLEYEEAKTYRDIAFKTYQVSILS